MGNQCNGFIMGTGVLAQLIYTLSHLPCDHMLQSLGNFKCKFKWVANFNRVHLLSQCITMAPL